MDQNYRGILAYCNEVRLHLGRKPVPSLRKGRPTESQGCVIAATINYRAHAKKKVYVGTDLILNEAADSTEALPFFVASFIEDFDAGALPDMVGTGWVA